jgi:hypothetical protein
VRCAQRRRKRASAPRGRARQKANKGLLETQLAWRTRGARAGTRLGPAGAGRTCGSVRRKKLDRWGHLPTRSAANTSAKQALSSLRLAAAPRNARLRAPA